jgi:hypothetical protein
MMTATSTASPLSLLPEAVVPVRSPRTSIILAERRGHVGAERHRSDTSRFGGVACQQGRLAHVEDPSLHPQRLEPRKAGFHRKKRGQDGRAVKQQAAAGVGHRFPTRYPPCPQQK